MRCKRLGRAVYLGRGASCILGGSVGALKSNGEALQSRGQVMRKFPKTQPAELEAARARAAAAAEEDSRRIERRVLGPWRLWVVRHDHSLWFGGLYIGLTLVLSILIGYFWLLLIVGVHLVLEYLKKTYLGYPAGRHRLAWTLWDLKYDLALVCLALTIAGYTGATLGAAGAQSVTRAGFFGIRLGKLGAFVRGLGKPFVDTLFSARVVLFRRADMQRARRQGLPLVVAAENRRHELRHAALPADLPWRQKLTLGDWLALAVIAGNLMALLSAPLWTDHSYLTLVESLAAKLHPWP